MFNNNLKEDNNININNSNSKIIQNSNKKNLNPKIRINKLIYK